MMSDYDVEIGTVADKRLTVKYLGREIGKGTLDESFEIMRLHREEMREEYPEAEHQQGRSRPDWDMCEADYL